MDAEAMRWFEIVCCMMISTDASVTVAQDYAMISARYSEVVDFFSVVQECTVRSVWT